MTAFAYRYLVAPVRRDNFSRVTTGDAQSAQYASVDAEQLIGPYDLDEDTLVLPRWHVATTHVRIGNFTCQIPSHVDRRMLVTELDRQNDLFTVAENRLRWYEGVFRRLTHCTRGALRHCETVFFSLRTLSHASYAHLRDRVSELIRHPLIRGDTLEMVGTLFDVLTTMRSSSAHDGHPA